MAKEMQEVLSMGTKHLSLIDFVERHVDKKLSDFDYVQQWRCGLEGHVFYRFAIPGVATEADKEELIRRYKAAGWGEVVCQNSSENGERPGMFGITLYQTSKNQSQTAAT